MCREDEIKRLNELGELDFIDELYYHGYITIKKNDYDFEIINGESKYGKEWDYSIHFYMEDGKDKFSFEVEINDEKSEMNFIPDEDDIDIKECIEEWGEYKPEHFRAFVMWIKGNAFA